MDNTEQPNTDTMMLFVIGLAGPDHYQVPNKYYAAISEMAYLHKDGEVRLSTKHEGELSGWFDSLEEVWEAIQLFKKTEAGKTLPCSQSF